MKRSEAVAFHQQEAAAIRRTAAEAPGSRSSELLLEQASDHDAMAEAARVGDYEWGDLTN
jgi:hypothetical protein